MTKSASVLTPVPVSVSASSTEVQAVQAVQTNGANDIKLPDFKRLPLAIDYFAELRDKGMIYVDKTDLIAEMVCCVAPVFIARPRRFGKTLLCSTLAELFANGTEKFAGLAIEHQWKDAKYPALYLSLANADLDDVDADPNDYIRSLLKEKFKSTYVAPFLKKAGIDISSYEDVRIATRYLREVVSEYYNQTGHQFVIIIDEYDDLLNQVIGNQSSFKQRLSWFTRFFKCIKTLRSNGYLRFVLITGVTRYQHTSIFSGFNNLEDLSFDPRFCTLFGYTKEEIKQNFRPYIEYGSKLLGMSFEEYFDRLRYEYDGYSFGNTGDSIKVYNPWSILKSCSALAKGDLSVIFDDFWTKSGGFSSFLVNFIKGKLQNAGNANAKREFIKFVTTDLLADFSLSKDLLTDPHDPYNSDVAEDLVTAFRVTMAQSGYYTIKILSADESEKLKQEGRFYCADGSEPFFLTVPNHEVASFLRNRFWANLSSFIEGGGRLLLADKKAIFIALLQEIFSGDPNKVLIAINEQLANVGYDNNSTFSSEASVRDYLVAMLRFADAIQKHNASLVAFPQVKFVNPETHGSLGRSDIFISSESRYVILELKLVKEYKLSGLDKLTTKQVTAAKNAVYDAEAASAIKQIKENRYYAQSPFVDTWCYGVVFSQEKRMAVRLYAFEHRAKKRDSRVVKVKAK